MHWHMHICFVSCHRENRTGKLVVLYSNAVKTSRLLSPMLPYGAVVDFALGHKRWLGILWQAGAPHVQKHDTLAIEDSHT